MAEHQQSMLPVMDMITSFHRQWFEMAAKMTREPVDIMLRLRPTLQPMMQSSRELTDVSHQAMDNYRKVVEATIPLMEMWMTWPLTCLDIMSRTRSSIESEILQFRTAAEETESQVVHH